MRGSKTVLVLMHVAEKTSYIAGVAIGVTGEPNGGLLFIGMAVYCLLLRHEIEE